MSRPVTLLKNAERMFELVKEDDGILSLIVVCGGIGLFEMKVPLRDHEVKRYEEEGEPYIEDLAYRITKSPQNYEGRGLVGKVQGLEGLLERGGDLVRVLQEEIATPVAHRLTSEEDDEALEYARDLVRELCDAMRSGAFASLRRGVLTRLAFERWPWGNEVSKQIVQFEHSLAEVSRDQ